MGFKEDMSRHFERFGRKTSAMLAEARLRNGIRSLENEIKSLYAVIGMTVYSMWKRHDVDTGRLVKHFETIDRKLEEIEEKKKMILLARAKGAEEEAEENAGDKPVRPLLPDYGGKINGETVPAEEKPAEPVSDAQFSASPDVQPGNLQDAQPSVSPDGVVIEEEDDGVPLPEGTESGQPDNGGHLYCPGCGTECPADANYCRRCGMKLR